MTTPLTPPPLRDDLPTPNPDYLNVDVDEGTQRLSRIYAEALERAAGDPGKADGMLGDLEALLGQLLGPHPEFRELLTSGAVPRTAKGQLIERAFRGKTDDLFVNFLQVLNRNNRLGLLPAIYRSYRDLADRRHNRVRVKVRSAVPLTDPEQDRLRRQLHAQLHQDPVLEPAVDPDLLGGLVVQVGDQVYDSSVRTRLETVRNQLLARSSYEIQRGRDRFSHR
jgi:F-type H+-transporting ATPase subunit delta